MISLLYNKSRLKGMSLIMFTLVPKTSNINKQKVILKKNPENNESIIFAITKKLKNNPCVLASVQYSSKEYVDIIVINNLKVKNHKDEFVINTSKKVISPDIPIKKIKKYFRSPEFQILAEPCVQIFLNEKDLIGYYPISELLDLKYSKSSIREFVIKEMKLFKSKQLRINLNIAN